MWSITYDSSSTTCSYVRSTRVPNFTCPTPILHHLHQTNAKQNRWHSRPFQNPKKASRVPTSAMPLLLLILISSVLPEKLAVPQLVTKFPVFYETQRSLQNSQQPATCPYPEPDQSRPCPLTLLEDPFNTILPITPRSSKWSLSLRSPQQYSGRTSASHTFHMPCPSHS
jgi:hypothetical protein